MKKRLLSAALALAMVLTMLPLSVAPAFAAATPPSPPSTGTVTNITWDEFTGDFAPTAVTYYAAGSTYQGYTIQTSGWYSAVMRNAAGANVCYFAPEATGVITAAIPSTGWANGNSGTLYPSVTMAAERGATSVTLLNSDTLDVNKATAYSMSINLNGKVLNVISSGAANKLTQLTLTDTAATKGSASGTISVTNRSFTLNNGNTNGTYPVNANGLNLTLTNTQTAGTAWGTGALTVNSYGGSLGAISTSNAKGTIRATNGGTISSITLGAVTEKDNRSGGSVTLETRAKVTSNLTIIGTGSLKLSGASQAGGVYLYGGSNGNTTAGTVPTWNGTTVDIDGTSTVGSINQGNWDLSGRHSITVKNRSTVGGITLDKGGSNTVKISDSTVTSGVKMVHGSLTVTNSSIGGITAAKPESWDTTTDGLSITVGTRNQADTSNTGNIIRESGNITIIPALTINGGTVGTISDNGDQSKATTAFSIEVWGGETGTRIPQAYLKGGLSEGYLIQKADSWLYTTDFQVVIDNYSKFDAGAYRVNDDTAINPSLQPQKVTFLYTAKDTKALADLYITKGTYVKLPTKVNNTTVQYWHQLVKSGGNNITEEALEAGKSYLFPESTNPIQLSVQLAPNTSNRVIEVKATDKDGTPIGCTLNGTTINLSGAVNTTGNTATIMVTFTMNDGDIRKATVGWATDGTITVTKPDDAGEGVVIPTLHSNTVQVYNVSYTFNGSGLRSKVSGISVPANLSSVAISVPNASAGMSGAFVELGKDLKKTLSESASKVDFSGAYGVKMALNALIAGQTESSVQGIVNQARNAMVAYDNRADGVNTHKVTDAKYTAYRYVVLTPYLEISSSNPTTTTGTAGNPILTLNITLKYRYTVTDGTYTAYKDIVNGVKTDWEQTGNLNVTGDYGTVAITLKMPTNLAFKGTSYAHHNGYVYTMSWSGNIATITNVNGFSPFVLNNTAPAATITDKNNNANAYQYGFDNLQTAVDAVKDGETIVMHENFTGSINMTGIARKFTLESADPNKVTVNLTGVNGASTTYDFDKSSNKYVIQLAANTLTPSGNVAISVVSVANGYARVSASSVKPGSVVTITTVPNAGYAATTPSVRYSTKTAASNVLSVTAAGANTWNFTVPADATGVTVTPGFVLNTVVTTVPYTDVSSTAWYYPGVEYCYNTVRGSARLMQGMNDANTIFSPSSGFTRAQVVQILWNMKGRPAPRNTYNRFSDISSIHYAYNAMLWAVQNGYAEGYPDGTFRPNQYVTRQEMAVFLWRAAGKPTGYNTLNLNNYNDGNQVYDWAQPAVRWAVATGVLSGQGSVAVGRYLAPRAVAYRSEVAVTVMNFDKLAVFR